MSHLQYYLWPMLHLLPRSNKELSASPILHPERYSGMPIRYEMDEYNQRHRRRGIDQCLELFFVGRGFRDFPGPS